jgi:hypothetical protein
VIIVLLSAISSGLLALAVGWSKFGLMALVFAPAAASTAALLSGMFLAILRMNKFDKTEIRYEESGPSESNRNERATASRHDSIRCYFDIERTEKIFHDHIGVKSESMEKAIDEARSVIQEMAEEVISENPGATLLLAVRDESAATVTRLPIEKIITEAQKRSA